MNKFSYLILASLTMAHTLFAMDKPVTQTADHRGLIVIIDPLQSDGLFWALGGGIWTAVSNLLYDPVKEQRYPIYVSRQLVDFMASQRPDIVNWIQTYGAVYVVNDFYVLLVPPQYPCVYRNTPNGLGLYTENLERTTTLSQLRTWRSFYSWRVPTWLKSAHSYIFTHLLASQATLNMRQQACIDGLRHVLSPKTNIEWDIVFGGHGDHLTIIGGLEIPYFRKLLDFCDKEIRTHTLTYASCHGGGQIKDLAIQGRTYSFPILTPAIGEEKFALWPPIHPYLSGIATVNIAPKAIATRFETAGWLRCANDTSWHLMTNNSMCAAEEIQQCQTTIPGSARTVFLTKPVYPDLTIPSTTTCIRSTLSGHRIHYITKLASNDLAQIIRTFFTNWRATDTCFETIYLIEQLICEGKTYSNVTIFLNALPPTETFPIRAWFGQSDGKYYFQNIEQDPSLAHAQELSADQAKIWLSFFEKQKARALEAQRDVDAGKKITVPQTCSLPLTLAYVARIFTR